ncbi:hypothetical protein F5Y10DRAFT_247400 [Nemania abortiva]|nr:hypothetical protein F5Y10DRAFT_247400 [Nemania abortiva]
MDQLSQEIIDTIVSFIPRLVFQKDAPIGKHPPALPVLAAVSQSFQRAAERLTFKSLYINATDEELEDFEQILNPRRLSNVRTLFIMLPLPCDHIGPAERRNHHVMELYRQEDRKATTAPLRRLWNFLGGRNENAAGSGSMRNVSLHLSTEAADVEDDRNAPRFDFLPLDLTGGVGSFPALHGIREFKFENGFRHWNPRVPAVFTSTMSDAERVCWELDEASYDWGRYYSVDKKYRSELVSSFQAMRLPSSVKDFTCYLKQPSHRDPGQVLPRFVGNGEHDPVSCAMRELTRDCAKVSLRGSFHPSLFDPPRSGPGAEEQPCWQQMTRLHVEMALCSPDGSWLFRPETHVLEDDLPEGLIDCTRLPPGYGDTEEELEEAEDYYEDHEEIIKPPTKYESNMGVLVPDDERLNALLTAFARGCARMPVLEVADLRIDYENGQNWPFQVICVQAAHRLEYWNADIANDSSLWRVYLHADGWKPTEATLSELKNIGVERNGQPSTICFLEWGDFYD